MAVNIETFAKLVYVGRCAKVVKGGRRFSFAAIVVVGDGNGKVGIGLGKASEVLDAKEKATVEARKSMKKTKIHLREGRTLHHDIEGKFGAGKVYMRAASPGTGIIAGGPIRAVCEGAGIKDIVVKSIGSSNPHNMIKAALDALLKTRSPKSTAERRGMKVGEIIGRREKSFKSLNSIKVKKVVLNKIEEDLEKSIGGSELQLVI
jgi:small subunit ribosomal protein S5